MTSRFRALAGFATLLAAIPAASAFAQFTEVVAGDVADPGPGFGLAWGDFDKDGDLDLYLANGDGANKVLRNEGGGVFVQAPTGPLGVSGAYFGVAAADYDNDGDLDLYLANGIGANRLLENDSAGYFTDVTAGTVADSGASQSVAWGDYDSDGLVDLYVTNWGGANRLLHNEGSGLFSDTTPPIMADSSHTQGATFADYDNDGDLDLYVASQLGAKLFKNNGGTFADATPPVLGKVGITGMAWGDYDNDGDLDLYVSRNVLSNRLLRNDREVAGSDSAFVDLVVPAIRDPGISQSVCWLDYDCDGDLDILVTNAGDDNQSGDTNRLFRNDESPVPSLPAPGPDSHLTFSEVTTGPIAVIGNSRGAASGDYDGDGLPDLYVVNWREPNQLLHNTSPAGNHWLRVKLVATVSNRAAIGARVRVVAGGISQIREIASGSGLYSQGALEACFGLGPVTSVDSVLVSWPSGMMTDTTLVGVDQEITLIEFMDQTSVPDLTGSPSGLLHANFPNPFRRATSIRYELREASSVELVVLDVSGRLVRTLERSRSMPPGSYTTGWDGRGDRGEAVSAGIYFYRLTTGNAATARRMILLP